MKGLKFLALVVCSLITFPVFSQAMYLEININEERNNSLFPQTKSQLEVFRVIEKAAGESRVKGIIINVSSVSHNREYLWELRSALEQFKKSDKKIIAFISNANMDIYTLASVADKIVMDELGTLNMMGYSVGKGYVHNSLEKLGIGVRELKYFEYKTASETMTRDSLSEADRKQYNDYLDDIFFLTRDTLKNARNWTDEDFDTIINQEFLYSARNALNRNIVDGVGRKEAVNEAIKELEGKEIKNFTLYGAISSSVTGSRTPYSPPGSGGSFFYRPPVIAVVYANGQTDMERGMNALKLSRTIRELADRRRVKAIVVRINSPGGSAEAADYLAEAIRYAKEKKPVVVSMGQVAASGGYWASMYANHIMATPYTITGSIGVIGSWFYDKGFNSKLGVSTDTLQRGNHADLYTGVLVPYRNLTDEEENRYKNYILDLYGVFTEKVALGRNMEIDKVEAVAQGRIFSGTRALEEGLIDSIGSLQDALQKARELAGIKDRAPVRYDEFPKQKFMDRFMNRFPALARLFSGNRQNSAGLITDLFLPDADILYRLEKNGQVMPILPLEFTVK